MTDSLEQARFRQHLAELARVARSIGRDVEIEDERLGRKIDRLGRLTGRDAKDAIYDIEDGLTELGHHVNVGARRLPGAVADGIVNAGDAMADRAVEFGQNTADAMGSAGHRARERTQSAFARAAGVKKTPMREWGKSDSD